MRPGRRVLCWRRLAWGIECQVISPTHIRKASGDKTKGRGQAGEAAALGGVKGIHIPDERDEAVRDLCRARTDAGRICGCCASSSRRSCCATATGTLRELVMCHPAQKFVLEETLNPSTGQSIGSSSSKRIYKP